MNMTKRQAKRKPFNFVNAVTELEEYKPLVDAYWKATEPLFLSTSTLFRFSKRLKGLKPLIRNLAKAKMGNLVKKSREAYEDLCSKQEATMVNPTQQNMDLESAAASRWDLVARLEENFLKKKSKLHWLNIGDKNNKTFHRAVATREAINCIKEILCRDGTLTRDENEIKKEAGGFFHGISAA